MKRLAALLTAAALAFSWIVAVPSASAQVVCASQAHRWSISDGTNWPYLDSVRLKIEVCTNGREITSTTATQSSERTAPAVAAMWSFDWQGTPDRVWFNSGTVAQWGMSDYHEDVSYRECGFPSWVPFLHYLCSYTSHARVVGVVRMRPWSILPAGPGEVKLLGRVFYWQWAAYCTNSVCKARFH